MTTNYTVDIGITVECEDWRRVCIDYICEHWAVRRKVLLMDRDSYHGWREDADEDDALDADAAREAWGWEDGGRGSMGLEAGMLLERDVSDYTYYEWVIESGECSDPEDVDAFIEWCIEDRPPW